jgi:hypothetical protein
MNAHFTRFGRTALCATVLVAPSAAQPPCFARHLVFTPADILATSSASSKIPSSELTDGTTGP